MTKTKRIHISLPEKLLKAFDYSCKKNHMTRSEAIKLLLMMVVKEKLTVCSSNRPITSSVKL
ncbi:MAG: ribbon-helix-helix protein, CopG family [Methanogenium sp.]|jgi:metal-responsive CopG/Arc/MetJ family transcriptional regulator